MLFKATFALLEGKRWGVRQAVSKKLPLLPKWAATVNFQKANNLAERRHELAPVVDLLWWIRSSGVPRFAGVELASARRATLTAE